MAGIIGIYLFDRRWNAYNFGIFGLMALQHRGQETAGMEIFNESRQKITGKGLVEQAFASVSGKGNILIGGVSPYPAEEAEPLPVTVSNKVSASIDGKVTAIEGYKWDAQLAYEANLRRAYEELEGGSEDLEAIRDYFSRCKGGFSYIAANGKGEVIAGRGSLGVKPLVLGKMGFDGGIVASESCVMDIIGERVPISPAENIDPGDAMVFTPMSARTERVQSSPKKAYCIFEYVYLARPDSYINDVPVYRVRREIGRRLAQEGCADADVVIGVPETAIPFAMSYSNETGIPVEKGFELTGRRVRSAMKPNQVERLKGVQLKLNVISEAVRGKRVVLIDDSVVRGNTLANIVYLMKEKGAKEIHVRIGSPHIVSHCPFGVEVPGEDELIGRHLKEDKIAEVIGADSFKYLSLDGLVEATGLKCSEFCTGCFNGAYPEVE
ncbi:MAG: amidophosphoribosyltransferase [Candidatus Methanosuratincola sp.]|jgi:amidophosphoribosyltransferase|uniref:Amidophosphoribosyltransferase n=1 Tax=Candidatus Methanosuratincola petrocarbonis (ex Vanwonterghem et al. 2016) TaxID=1867261 RepID=A0A7J3V017_9CREN|nr:amidophosphoribosyltransferase [Candidatus Methanosuratincola sp.]